MIFFSYLNVRSGSSIYHRIYSYMSLRILGKIWALKLEGEGGDLLIHELVKKKKTIIRQSTNEQVFQVITFGSRFREG